ncbi:lipoprotein [Mycoplasma putrefaciens]|uniref:lipoprotein n=1 Tax=Mycoplasma putrefaciens TaxID=2123 RepID=UPI003DA498D8
MKKLLTFLGSFSLSAGGVLTVVSCSSAKNFFNPTITDELANKIIAGLEQNNNFNFNNGDIFYKLNFKEIIIEKLNQLISERKYEEIQKDLSIALNTIGFKSKIKSDQVLSNLATLKLFNEYTAKRSDKGNTDQVDLTYSKNFGLNPYELQKDSKNRDSNVYAIYYKQNSGHDWLRWQTTGEFTPENADDSKIDQFQIPELSILTDTKNNYFRIGILESPNDAEYISSTRKVNNNGMDTSSGKKIKWYATNGETHYETNGQNIIRYRFAHYFKKEIQSKLFSNLLGNSYLDSNLYFLRSDNSSAGDKKVILNGTNRLISNTQTDFTQQNSTTSNIKMVWSFSSSEPDKVYKNINEYVNPNGSLKSKKTLKEIYNQLSKNGEKDHLINESKQGNDSFLSISGFNGFVQNDKDSIKSLSGDLKINDSAKKDVSKVSIPSILVNGGSGYESTIQGNRDFLFVLPIYLNDIFSTKNVQMSKSANGSEYILNVLENTWTDISQKYKIDNKYLNEFTSISKIEKNGSDNIDISKRNKWYVKLKDGMKDGKINIIYSNGQKETVQLKKVDQKNYKTLDITQKLADNQKNREIFGSDLKDSFISYDYNLKDYQNLKEKQNDAYEWNQSPKSSADIIDLSTESKQALLDQLKSLTSSIEEVQNAAKTELYSQYLNADQIKYQELFDEISKFVRDDIPSLD